MNYAIVFLGAIFSAAAIWWYISGKKWYTGPLVEAEVNEMEIDGSGSGSGEDRMIKETK